jgi:hypothetical protein
MSSCTAARGKQLPGANSFKRRNSASSIVLNSWSAVLQDGVARAWSFTFELLFHATSNKKLEVKAQERVTVQHSQFCCECLQIAFPMAFSSVLTLLLSIAPMQVASTDLRCKYYHAGGPHHVGRSLDV